MAKKNQKTSETEDQRQSRKEILIARKQERQLRNIRIAVIVGGIFIALIIAIALVNELFITPNRAVATVGDQTITLREWQNRVKFERAQRIIFLENQLEAFGGDVGIVQQFGGSVINELFDTQTMGQNAINTMADELVICQGVEERGIAITDADVQALIGENYAFYGEGVSPTQPPPPTATIQPTPSLTPIPTAVITDIVPTQTPLPLPTVGPTFTPAPTATPVSEAEFQRQYGELVAQLKDLGVDESVYRQVVHAQLCRERLAEALTEELPISRMAEMASVFVITADSEESANEIQAMVKSDGFLTAWNTVASRPVDPQATDAPVTNAFELQWRTRESLTTGIGSGIAAAAFDQALNTPSATIPVTGADGTTTYYIIMVNGREDREMSETDFQARQADAVNRYVDERLTGKLQINDMWRSRVPTLPALDPKFLAPPTATPIVTPAATLAPESGEGD